MCALILFAPRYAGSRCLEDLRGLLGSADEPARALEVAGRLAPQVAAEIERARPVAVLGLPQVALSLAPTLAKRVTLILDGTESAGRLANLRGLRLASFSWSVYTAARRAGIDAALFTWAPLGAADDGAMRSNEAFVEPGGGRTLASIGAGGAMRLCSSEPHGLMERIRRLLPPRVETLSPQRAADVAAHCAVFVASKRRAGLEGGFFAAMARGAAVVAPTAGLFPQFITHGVSGFLEGHAGPAPEARSIDAAAARVMRQARRRFDDDRQRLLDFLMGETPARRTIARVVWEPAPQDLPPMRAAQDASEGGKRLGGGMHEDLPEAPLVTVAIVARNARESFAPTLASILAQDYPNVEIIVVDGASTDGTLDEIRARNGRVDYWISEKDRGPYDGMNKAARLARGRFLIFMNAGDYFAHERALSEAFEDPAMAEAEVIVGHHVYVDANGIEQLCKNADFNETFRCLLEGDLSWEWYNGVPCGQAVLIRTELLREQPFDPTYKIAADHAFLYLARANGRRFAHCDSVIGVYTSGGFSGADDRSTAAELLRIARTHGPREKIDAWFKRNLPIAFETVNYTSGPGN